jgi:adenosylcobinamide kinase/adenosylcobinamide-phosphate guanylyltransferase
VVDRRLLLDLGPHSVRSLAAGGDDPSAVDVVCVTHAHPDHLDPQALLWRAWAQAPTRPLHVFGPEPVVAAVQPWLGPASTVHCTAVTPGEEVLVAGFQLRFLAAQHSVPTVLVDVTTSHGLRVLYATDTGPLPEETVAAVAGAAFDVVLLEETHGLHGRSGTDEHADHLHLPSFTDQVRRLRAVDAVTDSTDVVAVHLGHGNPPEPALMAALAEVGARPGRDGERLGEPVPARGSLVTGGARSGKSRFAEGLLGTAPTVVYVATGPVPDPVVDAEWAARVARHRQRRPATWTTDETLDLASRLSTSGPPLLVDCLTLWLARVFDAADAWDEPRSSQGLSHVHAAVDELLLAWRARRRRAVLVTNEIGSGVVPEHWSGRVFRDELGRLNAAVAADADDVVLLVAGIPTALKGALVP